MTPADLTAKLRAEARAKFDAAIAEVERRTAHLPEEIREAIIEQLRTSLDAQLARLEREWAAFEHLRATGQLPAEGRWRPLITRATGRLPAEGHWRPLITLAAMPREPDEPMQ